MNVLRYKDYYGSVRFEDGRLIIQILHIDDLITAECDSASAARSAFEELVDDYIETCIELKKAPSKPFKGSLNVRIPPALHKQAALAAAERGESLNAFITQAVQAYLDTTGMGDLESQTAKARHLLTLASNSVLAQAQSVQKGHHWMHDFWESHWHHVSKEELFYPKSDVYLVARGISDLLRDQTDQTKDSPWMKRRVAREAHDV